MLGFVLVYVEWNVILNLKLRRVFNELHGKLVLPSTSTLSIICGREYSLIVDAIKKQLLSRDKVCLALNRWTSINKIAITSVIAYNIDQNWAL